MTPFGRLLLAVLGATLVLWGCGPLLSHNGAVLLAGVLGVFIGQRVLPVRGRR